MPADQREPISEVVSPNSSVSGTPHIASPSPSELSISYGSSDSDIATDTHLPTIFNRIEIPHEESLRDILLRVTGTNDLRSVTQVKLQVITNDVSLQHICFHTPQLTELNLDGSVVSSLRDLGCRLRNLKILRVCRCGLTSLDGMSGLQSVEELYAQNNAIQDLSPCSWLPHIRVIDLKRNRIKDICSVSFLSLCSNLEHLLLDDNEEVIEIPGYRQIIKSLLPNLKTLDEKDLTKEKDFKEYLKAQDEALAESDNLTNVMVEEAAASTSTEENQAKLLTPRSRNSSSKRLSLMEGNVTFNVRFPPKILSPRPSSGSSSDSSFTTHRKSEISDILHNHMSIDPFSEETKDLSSHTTNEHLNEE